jgi:pantetheine-phosphate adenylyltransferase
MRVVVAGTFGPLHDGHRRLFETALRHGDEGVVVGVTTDELARGSRTREVPPHDERLDGVRDAIDDLNEWGRTVDYRAVADDVSFAGTDPDVDALVVSPETADELVDVNDRRRENGLEPIEGLVSPYVLAADGERISSTRIVRGEIDEHGQLAEN